MTKLLICMFIATSLMASEKKELSFYSEVTAGRALPLMLEDLIEAPTVPADLLNMELPFTSGTIKQEKILNWLKSHRQVRRELSKYVFKIPESIEVTRPEDLSKAQITKRLQSRLLQRCQDCQFHIVIKNLPRTRGGTSRILWRDLPLSGPFMIPIENENGIHQSWLSGQIKTERKIVKAIRPLRFGDTIQNDDLKLEWADVSFNKDYFTEMKQLVGKKLARVISAQNALSSRDVQRNYDVRQGQTVKIKAGNEAYEISLEGIAQDSGVIGDSIRVRSQVNQKLLTGRIIEKGLVRVE